MKNIYHLIKLLPLAAALLTAGCSSDPIDEADALPKGGGETVTLSARIAEPNDTPDEASRVTVDVETLKVLWSSGDRITLFPNGTNTAVGATLREEYVGKAVGKFTAESAVATTAGHYALYPYTEGQTIDETTHRMAAAIPAEQTYRAESYGGMNVYMSAYAAAEEDYTLQFRTYVGALGIQLRGNVRVGKIRVVSESEAAVGEVDIEHRPGSMPVASARTTEGKSVTLLCPESTTLSSETQLFCIAMLPNTYKRLTVTIYDDKGNEIVTRTASNQKITRAMIHLMQPLVLEKPSYETYLGDWLVTGTASDTGEERSYRINISEKVYGESYNVKGWSSEEEGLTYPFELGYLAEDGSVSASFGQKVCGSYEGYTGIYVMGFRNDGSSLSSMSCTLTGIHKKGRIEWKLSNGMEAFEYFFQTSEGGYVYFNTMAYLLNPVSTRAQTPQDYFNRSVVQLQEHTKGKGVKLIFLGDGYTAANDLNKGGKFERDAHRAHEEYFAVEPYKTLRPYFDVYMIAAASLDSGTSNLSTNQTSNTYFSTVLEGGGSTGIKCDDTKVFNFVKQSGVITADEDLNNSAIVILINANIYAGTCISYYDSRAHSRSIGMVPVMSSDMFGKTLRHECGGHGWGTLADEYCYYYTTMPAQDKQQRQEWMAVGYYPNCTFETRDNAPWAHYYTRPGYEMVGYFEGAMLYYYGAWRPEEISCMDDNRNYFNAPSRERIWRRTMECAGETFSLDEFLAYDKINIGTAAALQRNMVERPMPPLGEPIMKDTAPSLDEIRREVEQRRKATATAVTLP